VVSYILPIRTSVAESSELDDYLQWLSTRTELIVVDGSAPPVFDSHARRWNGIDVAHIHVDEDLSALLNGKVAGARTGIRRATNDFVIIADDDVRYDLDGLARMESALKGAEVVRPQNYFDPLPWHAWLDTGRTLLNRMSGGDWPGTLGVRRSALSAAGGYDGDVLFENLELVRTVIAAGGREQCLMDFYVRRHPPSTTHFWSQRVRQAYDEFARPVRLTAWLAVVPLALTLVIAGHWRWLAIGAAAIGAVAEMGRRRNGGARVFPFAASLAAPLWVCERGVCAWLAAAARLLYGGVPYHGRILTRAATPVSVLQQRLRDIV